MISALVAVSPSFRTIAADDRFTFIRMGCTENSDLFYGRMFVQKFLHFGRPHFKARHVDHVLDPIDNKDVALIVQHSDIAGMQPPVPQCVLGFGGLFPISFHDSRTADTDFAPFADRHFAIILIQNFYLEILDGCPDAAEFVAEVVIVAGKRRAFGQSVAFVDRTAKAFSPAGGNFTRHRCRCGKFIADG